MLAWDGIFHAEDMLDTLYHSIDPVAFTVGPLTVRWYGIAYLVGFCLAALIVAKVAKHWKLKMDDDAVLTIMVCVIVGILVGARVGYCLFYGDGYYLANPLKIFAFNEGGMSFHGGLVGALVSGIVAARLTHIPYLTLADLGAIAAPLGLFFGRCANFINGELWGSPTDLPGGVAFGGAAGDIARHPTQLYEALLEGIVIFCVLILLARKVPPRPRGTFIGVFLILYGIFRILIEFVRQPDAQLGYLFGGWLTMGIVLSVPLIVAGAAALIYAKMKHVPQEGSGRTGAQAFETKD